MAALVASKPGLRVRVLCLRVRGGRRNCGGGLGVVDVLGVAVGLRFFMGSRCGRWRGGDAVFMFGAVQWMQTLGLCRLVGGVWYIYDK